jgi:hypothetical protein
MRIPDEAERAFYTEECAKSAWSVRQLERQIHTMYYQRLLSSQDKAPVSAEIQTTEPKPEYEKIVKDPYVMEFLANNDLYLRTPYTGTEGHADPRRWEMASRVLDASGNDLALLAPIVGQETADAFIRFFKSRRQLESLGSYTDEELVKMSVARRYQLAQQCLQISAAHAEEARALMNRLGGEYLAWYEYMLKRKAGM